MSRLVVSELVVICFLTTVLGTFAEPTVVEYSSNEVNAGDGEYEFSFHLSDGTSRWQVGHLKKDSNGNPFISTKGRYTYYDDQKNLHTVWFVADENGYRVVRPPPPATVPPRIASASIG